MSDEQPTTTQAFGVVIAAHVALFFFGGIVLSVGGWKVPYPISGSFAAAVPFWIVAVVLSRRVGTPHGLAWSIRTSDIPLGVVVGVATQLVLPVVYWPLLKATGLSQADVEAEAQKLLDASKGAGGTFLLVVYACLVAPIVEELLYRGLFLGTFSRSKAVLGVAATAALFAVLHLQPLQFLGLFVFGVVAGALRIKTGRVGASVVAHVAFNSVTVLTLLASR